METYLVLFLMMYFGSHNLDTEEVNLESDAAIVELESAPQSKVENE